MNKRTRENGRTKKVYTRMWICLPLCVALAINNFPVRAQNESEVLGEIGGVNNERGSEEENIQSKVPAIEVMQRSGGTYIDGIVFSTEEVVYSIRVGEREIVEDSEEDSTDETGAEIAFFKYRAGELEGKAPIENNYAQFTIQADHSVFLEVWYVENDKEVLVLEEYILPDRQKPEIVYKRVEKEGRRFLHVTMKETGENPSGIRECRFARDGEIFVPDTINTLDVYHLPNGQETPVLQEVEIPVDEEVPYTINIEVTDNAGNIISESISTTFDPELPVIEIVQRTGGIYMDGIVFPLEDVVYGIKIGSQEENEEATFIPEEGNGEETACVKYKAGELDGTAVIENNYAQFKVPADTNGSLQLWYVDKGGEHLIAEEYFVLDRQKPEIVSEMIEKDGKQYIQITIMETEQVPSGIRDSYFEMDGEPLYPDAINILQTYRLPNGQEVPVKQEITIPVEQEKVHEIAIETFDHAGNEISKVISTVSDKEVNVLPKAVSAEILERAGGIYEQGVVFSSEAVTYSVKITKQQRQDSDMDAGGTVVDGENVFLKYKAGELEGTSQIENGLAQITLPTGIMAFLQVWYVEGDKEYFLFEEQLVLENDKPEVICEKIEKNGEQYAHIVITEQGGILSGIKECHFSLDGEPFVPDEIKTLAVYELLNEWKVPVQQEMDILLNREKAQEIQVEAVDYAGNYVKKSITLRALPEDVVSVIVPTSFDIAIRPYDMDENRQIYSDDIVVCNKSNFPVDVVITNVEVVVNHLPSNDEEVTGQEAGYGEIVKDCSVNLQLRRFDQDSELIPLTEGDNENIHSFSLDAKNGNTDSQALMQMQYAGTINSSDYAIINLVGNLKEGSESMWQSGDLSIRLVFDFKKQQ